MNHPQYNSQKDNVAMAQDYEDDHIMRPWISPKYITFEKVSESEQF